MKYLLIVLVFVSESVFGNEILSEWKTKRKTNRIEMQYRWVMLGDTLKTREMRLLFEVEATRVDIVNFIKYPENVNKWMLNTSDYQIFNEEEYTWNAYNLYAIPYPFPNLDMVTEYVVNKSEEQTIVEITSMPEILDPVNNVKRIKYYKGYWKMQSVCNGKTLIEFLSISSTKPVVPRFIQDPIVERVMINSIDILIDMVESSHHNQQLSLNRKHSDEINNK